MNLTFLRLGKTLVLQEPLENPTDMLEMFGL